MAGRDLMFISAGLLEMKRDRPQSSEKEIGGKLCAPRADKSPNRRTGSVTMPLPKLNKFKEKKAALFEVDNTRSTSVQQRRKPKVKPPTAWGEHVEYGSIDPTDRSSGKGLQRTGSAKSVDPKVVSSSLRSLQDSLSEQHLAFFRDENLTRQRIFKNANAMIQGLPLQYLFSKPELRRYALEQIYNRLMILALLREKNAITDAFQIWKSPPEIKLDDKQVGFLVISKALQGLLDKILLRAFKHWCIFYATRYDHLRLIVLREAATDIQRWYRNLKATRSENYQRLLHAVKVCLQRRKAIKFAIRFEIWSRKALIKITKAVVHRRRLHLAARSIQRVYRWTLWYRRVMWRLIRVIAVRKLQRFWRMELARPDRDHVIIKTIIRAGGYSKVFSKVPTKLSGKDSRLMMATKLKLLEEDNKKGKRRQKKTPPQGLLTMVDNCVRIIQKAWIRYKGRSELYAKLMAERLRKERERIRNEKATIIQNSFRAHLWDLLMLAARQHNRARRIQKGFRAYQWRYNASVWATERINTRRRKRLRIRDRFLRRALLWAKFKLRRKYLNRLEKKRFHAAFVIQRAYRQSVERERLRLEEEKRRRDLLRSSGSDAIMYISRIQRNFRQTRTKNNFPYHVKLLMQRLDRKRRYILFAAAYKIQKLVKGYVTTAFAQREGQKDWAVHLLQRLARCYLFRSAMYYRVRATRKLRAKMSNRIKYWWRKKIFLWEVRRRFYLMRERIDQERFIYRIATQIQRYLHRRWMEYFSPMRVAARNQIKKRLEREEEERIWRLRDGASRRIQKAFRGVVVWNKNLRRIDVERVYYRRHRAAKKIQKFFKMVVAWARFWTAADDRLARKLAEEKRIRYTAAANVIGFYWRRWKEKRLLKTLFVLRRRMIDEYNELTRQRLQAESEKQDALDEVKRSEETMMATVASAWRQGSDPQGRNYYYNYITGESSWTPPESWKVKQSEVWVRNKDDRDNIYYYNMQTGESRWLPPCCVCGLDSVRFCLDCGTSYCEECFESSHIPENMKNHEWSSVETEREPLKNGEVHCVECKKRVAKLMCTTCWDPYCPECFKYIHHIGALRDHKAINYRKAKLGWLCIKARIEGERDYYVNGTTGETTYEKPEELMTDQEKVYYENFKAHKEAAEEHVKRIDKLQFDLEAASYERDTILFDAINGTGKIGQLLKNRNKQRAKAEKKVNEKLNEGTGGGGAKKTGGILGFLGFGSQADREYRQMLMSTNPRERKQARDEYIQTIINNALGVSEEEGEGK